MNKHNPKQDVLVVNGYVIPVSDLASDEIEFRRAEEGRYEAKVGIGGGTQHMRKANDNGVLTFSVFQGSDAHKFFLGLYELGAEVVSCSYKKGGIEMPPIIGTQGVINKLSPASSSDAKVMVEILTSSITQV